jgi:hypothetical protein
MIWRGPAHHRCCPAASAVTPEGVLAGHATLQPSGEDGFGLVPQGPVSVLGDAGGAIGEVAGCRPRAVRAIGLERQQRGRAGDRVGEDQVGDAGLAGRQQQMLPGSAVVMARGSSRLVEVRAGSAWWAFQVLRWERIIM